MASTGGRPNKIRSAGLEGVVRKLAGEGLGYRAISDELKRRGHDVAYSAVARFLSEEAGERREIARNIATEEAHDAVPLVTQSLKRWVSNCGELIKGALAELEKPPTQAAEGSLDALEGSVDKERRIARTAETVSKLVNAGSKAAKLLYDITAGDQKVSEVDAVRDEAMAILAEKRKREASAEQAN
jgi:hypothetical protein